jgi:hypothetical protein
MLKCLSPAALLAAALLPGAALAGSMSTASNFCDRQQSQSAADQDRLLRFAAVVREELNAGDSGAALVSRSGLDLSRFKIRYSHAAIAWRGETGIWTARQLYYACDESRPRIFDQGVAGFSMGTDTPELGYVSIVRLPAAAADSVHKASLDNRRALHLLANTYSANAYAFGLRYQNCNQWVMELLAVAFGQLEDGEDLRAQAQAWLRTAGYVPEPVEIGSSALMLASYFVPLLHLNDHPREDRVAKKLKVSLPSSVEQFLRQRWPESERVEVCHSATQVVVHHGWSPVAEGCVAGPGDRVVTLD